MPRSLTEPVPAATPAPGKPETKPLRVPVKWTVTGFECTISGLAKSAEATDSAITDTEPVRLRVSETEADSCRVEFFYAEACLCGVSAGC